MATWRVGRKLGRTLYKDDQCVGMVDSPELAAEIARTMNGTSDSRMLALHMAQWIVSHPSGMKDHACARCVPCGPILRPGFMCAQHVAEGLLAAAKSSST